MNDKLIGHVGKRLEEHYGAEHSGPGTRWTIHRRGGRSVHVVLNRGKDPAAFTGWIFDCKAVLGSPATFISVPLQMAADEFLAAVSLTRGIL
jgi:hypothetical protein